jgi:hypothetical protein
MDFIDIGSYSEMLAARGGQMGWGRVNQFENSSFQAAHSPDSQSGPTAANLAPHERRL